MNCGNEMKMKTWSSQWTQLMQLRKEALKKIQDLNAVWTRDLVIPVRCSTNWPMKPLTLGAGQLWVHMFPWKKWVLMVYEINHIWIAEMIWKWRNDRRSERSLCNCVKKPWCSLVQFGATWWRLVQLGADWGTLVKFGATWCNWCNWVQIV